MLLRIIGGESVSTGLDAFLWSFCASRRFSRNRSPSRLSVSPMYNFLQRVQVMQSMTLAEVQVNWISDLDGSLWARIFSQRYK